MSLVRQLISHSHSAHACISSPSSHSSRMVSPSFYTSTEVQVKFIILCCTLTKPIAPLLAAA